MRWWWKRSVVGEAFVDIEFDDFAGVGLEGPCTSPPRRAIPSITCLSLKC
jgi:hypothetical protein